MLETASILTELSNKCLSTSEVVQLTEKKRWRNHAKSGEKISLKTSGNEEGEKD